MSLERARALVDIGVVTLGIGMRGVLVADLGVQVVLHAHLPHDVVGEAGVASAPFHEAVESAAAGGSPILVVAGGDDCVVTVEHRRIPVEIPLRQQLGAVSLRLKPPGREPVIARPAVRNRPHRVTVADGPVGSRHADRGAQRSGRSCQAGCAVWHADHAA